MWPSCGIERMSENDEESWLHSLGGGGLSRIGSTNSY